MTFVGPTIALVALAVSVTSFVVNLRAARRAERHGRMPVLIPVSPIDEHRITIRNVGNGPAVNVVIAHAAAELATEDALDIDLSESRYRTMWGDQRHLEPIDPAAERSYPWNWRGAVGLTYTDALGTHYTTPASAYGTKVVDGRWVPKRKLRRVPFPTGSGDVRGADGR